MSGPISFITRAVKADRVKEEGFAENAYGMSKIGSTVMSVVQQKEMDEAGKEDIVINSVSSSKHAHKRSISNTHP